jgi:hypothetical protein
MLFRSDWHQATDSILQHYVFFCGCFDGKTFSSRTSGTGGLPFGKNYLKI